MLILIPLTHDNHKFSAACRGVIDLNGRGLIVQMDNRIMQIRIEGQLTGVTGLEEIIKAIAEHPGQMSDSEIAASLLIRIQKLNYVPSKRRKPIAKLCCVNIKNIWGMRWR